MTTGGVGLGVADGVVVGVGVLVLVFVGRGVPLVGVSVTSGVSVGVLMVVGVAVLVGVMAMVGDTEAVIWGVEVGRGQPLSAFNSAVITSLTVTTPSLFSSNALQAVKGRSPRLMPTPCN